MLIYMKPPDLTDEKTIDFLTKKMKSNKWKLLTEKEFAQSKFFSYSPIIYVYEQIHISNDKELYELIPFDDDKTYARNFQLFWTSVNEGYAIYSDYWKGKIYYFQFGCQHEYAELSYETCKKRGITHHGHCWHVTECKKCGDIFSYDSSG